MAAPTKATILGKDPSTNKYTIRIPLLETSVGTEIYKTKATLCCEDGVLNPYNVGDVVYVIFENDQYESPVIIGKLSKEGLIDTQKNKPAASYKVAELTVLGNTQLSRNTKIGDISYNDIAATIRQVGNMPEKITSINGLSGGKLTSPIVFDGGDGLNANKIVLDQNKKGQITDTSTSTLLGFLNSNTLTVGGVGYALNLRGSGTRPTYKGNELSLLSDISTNQATSTVIRDALTNINGRVLSSYEATYYSVSQSSTGYAYYHITKNNNNLTEEEAEDYMEYMTGSRFLPTFNYEKPVNSIFIMADGSFWKPQYSSENGLDLYNIPNPYTTLFKHTVSLGIFSLVFYNNVGTPFDFSAPTSTSIQFLHASYAGFPVFRININPTTKEISILYLDASNTFRTDTIDGSTRTDVVSHY